MQSFVYHCRIKNLLYIYILFIVISARGGLFVSWLLYFVSDAVACALCKFKNYERRYIYVSWSKLCYARSSVIMSWLLLKIFIPRGDLCV